MPHNVMASSWRGPASSSSAAAKVAKWKRKGSKGDQYYAQRNGRWSPLALSFAALVLFSFTGFVASHLWNAVETRTSKQQTMAGIALGKRQGVHWHREGRLEQDPHHQQYGDDYPTFFEAQVSGLPSISTVSTTHSRTGVHAHIGTHHVGPVIHITRKPGAGAQVHVAGKVRSAGLWEGDHTDADSLMETEQRALSEKALDRDVTAGSRTESSVDLKKGQVPTWLGEEGGWGGSRVEDDESNDQEEQEGETAAVGEDGALEMELADDARKVSSAGLLEFLWKREKREQENEHSLKKKVASDEEKKAGKSRARNPWDDGDDRPRKLLLQRASKLMGIGGHLLRGGWKNSRNEKAFEGSAVSGHHANTQLKELDGQSTGIVEEEGREKRRQKGANAGKGANLDGQEQPWARRQNDRRRQAKDSADVQASQSELDNQEKMIITPARDHLWRFWLRDPVHKDQKSGAV